MKNDRLSPEELENNRKKLEEERPRLVILLLQWLLPPFILTRLGLKITPTPEFEVDSATKQATEELISEYKKNPNKPPIKITKKLPKYEPTPEELKYDRKQDAFAKRFAILVWIFIYALGNLCLAWAVGFGAVSLMDIFINAIASLIFLAMFMSVWYMPKGATILGWRVGLYLPPIHTIFPKSGKAELYFRYTQPNNTMHNPAPFLMEDGWTWLLIGSSVCLLFGVYFSWSADNEIQSSADTASDAKVNCAFYTDEVVALLLRSEISCLETADNEIQSAAKTNLTSDDKIWLNEQHPNSNPVWSPDGTEIVFVSDRDEHFINGIIHTQIFVMNSDGTNEIRLTDNNAQNYQPSWSPDGTKIVFASNRDGNYEIYTMNADGSNQIRVTNNDFHDHKPSLSPDGTKILFASNRDRNFDIYTINADGTNQTRLTTHVNPDNYPTWSHDGTKIAFTSWRDGNPQVYTMDADGTNQTNITNTPSYDMEPSWSPDGTKIAYYVADRNDLGEIYIMDIDGSNQKNITNTSNFSESDPSWSPDGTKIASTSIKSRGGLLVKENMKIQIIELK